MDRVNAIQVFIRVIETCSFSKAASELGITQPTATKAIAATEERLGVRLLHRSTRGVTPTEAGALYCERCKTIERAIDEAEHQASQGHRRAGGLLRISTSVAFGRRDDRWRLTPPAGSAVSPPVSGPFRSNNLSAVLAAASAGMGLAILPWYVARAPITVGAVQVVMADHGLPAQEMHAVYPSPKLVPQKVTQFIDHLQQALAGEWWLREP